MEIINGKSVAESIKKDVQYCVEEMVAQGLTRPCLACVLVGDDPASQVYVNSKEKTCAQLGINSVVKRLSKDTTPAEVASVIDMLNNDNNVSGILLQLPLPQHLQKYTEKLVNLISPQKDVDCLTTQNVGKLAQGKGVIAPCTPAGIMELLNAYNIDLTGKLFTVVGRSELVGKPLMMLALNKNATVQICHSKTQNLAQETKRADILVVAAGKPNLINADMVKEGAVVIDVGIHRKEVKYTDEQTGEQKCKQVVSGGDVDFNSVKDKCSYITPVPGGVGPMTIAMLMKNTLTLHQQKLQDTLKTTQTFSFNKK